MEESRISVLHFANTLVRAGVEEHILTLLRGLDRKYFRLYLVCTPEVAEKLQPDLPGDVELVPVRTQKSNFAAVTWRLAQILRARRIDILHSHLFQSSLLASPIGRLCRVPAVVETPHVREQWRKGWLKGSFVVDRLVGRSVDYYIAVSEANARYLVKQKGLPATKIVVIRNGVDLTRFDPAHPVPPGMKRSLGFEDGDPVLVVIARLEPQKGHHVLLEALPAVRGEFRGVRLVCVGEGALRGKLEAQVRSLGLEQSVRFVGYQSDPVNWLSLADVTLLPSYFEGLPIIAIESLATGKPMVATAVDGTSEVIVDEKTGLTVPPGDPQALAGAICRLLREPQLRQSLGSAGRQWVVEHFSQERQVQRTQEFYLRSLKLCQGHMAATRRVLYVEGSQLPNETIFVD